MILTKCPICKNILLNTFVETLSDRSEFLQKICNSSLSHRIHISFDNFCLNIIRLHILYRDNGFLWSYEDKKLTYGKARYNNNAFLYSGDLPWVEPDLQDLRKTIHKLQKYILFS